MRRSNPAHVVVLGAGPEALSAAVELVRRQTPVTVLATGRGAGAATARFGTIEFMGCRFDVGARLFRPERADVRALWNEVLGEEMPAVPRRPRIRYRGKDFDNPIRLSNAYLDLGIAEAGRCLTSYARARLRPLDPVGSYGDVVSNQVGPRIFSIFGATYLEKVWGLSADGLSAEWAGRGISPVDGGLGDLRQAFYPRLGAGQVWEGLAARLDESGFPVWAGQQVTAVRHAGGRVIAVATRDSAGRSIDVLGSDFICSMPVCEVVRALWPPAPIAVRAAADALRYRNVITVNVVLDRGEVFLDHAIAVHDASVAMARITNWKNLRPEMVADAELTGLGIEYFCADADPLWAMSDADLLDLSRRELVRLGLCMAEDVKAGIVARAPRAFAVYSSPEDPVEGPLAVIRDWLGLALPNLRIMEREGIEQHDRATDPTARGIAMARSITLGEGTGATGPRSNRQAPASSDLVLGRVGGYTGRVFAPE